MDAQITTVRADELMPGDVYTYPGEAVATIVESINVGRSVCSVKGRTPRGVRVLEAIASDAIVERARLAS